MTHFLNVLSTFSPTGEHFLIDSVRSYRYLVADPKLRQAVAGFIGQGIMHTREHVSYSSLLDRAGPPATHIDRFIGKFLNVLRKYTLKSRQLAVTVALEHYTATPAGQVPSYEDGLGHNSRPGHRQIQLWRVMGETEHKVVSYDIWNLAIKSGVGRYLMRTLTMLVTTIIFWAMVLYVHLRPVFADRTVKHRFLGFGKTFHLPQIHPASLRKIIPELFDFFRPSFHPRDEDDRGILERPSKLISEIEVYVVANGEAPSPSIRHKLSMAGATGS